MMNFNRRKTIATLLCTALPGLPLHAQETRAALVDETWLDTAREREVPVKLRWPHAAAHPGQRPAVLFSHGLGGTREGGAVWSDAWAAAGFVVVHLQHAGSDFAALRSLASSFTDKNALRLMGSAAQLLARLRDVGFALDEMGRRHAAGVGRWGAVRPVRAGLCGHSLGAVTTLGMAGQRYPHSDGVTEPRLAAFIALSPSLPASGNAVHAFERVTRPLLSVTGTRDGDVAGTGATPEKRMAVFAALPTGVPPGNKAHLVLQDADHMTFSGQTDRAMENVPREAVTRDLQNTHHALVAEVSTDWWRATSQDDAGARSRLSAPASLRAGDLWQRK